MKRSAVRDWPGLMKPATARAYLDDMAEAVFNSVVTPFLERRIVAGDLHYTRRSLDLWIDQGGAPREARTEAELLRWLDDDPSDDLGTGDTDDRPLHGRRDRRRSGEPHRPA
jgi:hypothetical protein